METIVKGYIFVGFFILVAIVIYARFQQRIKKIILENPARRQFPHEADFKTSQLSASYDEIIESFERYLMYWSIEVIVENTKIQLWFGVGMFKKLQLNVVRFNDKPIWIGRYYLDIGGPSKNPNYIYNHQLLSKNEHPEKYFYEITDQEEIPNFGFKLEYSITKSLQKYLSICPANTECEWRYEERGNYTTNYQKIISSKPVALPQKLKSIDLKFYSESAKLNKAITPDPSQPIFLGHNHINKIKIILRKKLIFCMADRNCLNDDQGLFDSKRANDYFRREFRSDLTIERIQAGNVSVSLNGVTGPNKKISLSLQDVTIEQENQLEKRPLLRLGSFQENDDDVVSITFNPVKIGNTGYLFICSL